MEVFPTTKVYICGTCEEFFENKSELEKHKLVAKCVKSKETSARNQAVQLKIFKTLLPFPAISLKRMPAEKGSRITLVSKENTGKNYTAFHKFECPDCENRYIHKTDLERHIRAKHVDRLTLTFSCTVCNNKFFTETQLKHHTNLHHTERMFKCPQCDRAFLQKDSISRHLIRNSCPKGDGVFHKAKYHSHPNQQFFGCPLCNKKFLRKRSIRIHLRLLRCPKSLVGQTTTTKNIEMLMNKVITTTVGSVKENQNSYNIITNAKSKTDGTTGKRSSANAVTRTHFKTATNKSNIHKLKNNLDRKRILKSSNCITNGKLSSSTQKTLSSVKKAQSDNRYQLLKKVVSIRKHKFLCKLCTYTSYYSSCFAPHLRNMHNVKDLLKYCRCSVCEHKVAKEYQISEPKWNEIHSRIYFCKYCDVKFDSGGALRKHRWQCLKKKEADDFLSTFRVKNIPAKTKKEIYIEENNNDVTAEKNALPTKETKDVITVSKCSTSTTSNTPALFSCTFCDCDYRHSSFLKKHVEFAHRSLTDSDRNSDLTKIGGETWQCELCMILCDSEDALISHQKRH